MSCNQFSENQLAEKPASGKWSKKEILGHLVDSARYNLMRFSEIPHMPEPYHVRSYQQAELVAINDYQSMKTPALVLLWQSLNKQICEVLKNIPSEALSKKVVSYGEILTFEWLIVDYSDHMEHHFSQIFDATPKEAKPLSYHFSTQRAREVLAQVSTEFALIMEYDDLEVEYYKPDQTDKQLPHTRDELYIIASGEGSFSREQDVYQVKTNDVLFVKAHETHRFFDFSDDFATWVVFYGLER